MAVGVVRLHPIWIPRILKLTELQTYMPLFLPPPPNIHGTFTEAPAAVPP